MGGGNPPPFFHGADMDSTIKVTVTTDGKRQTYTFTVENVYGTLFKSQDVGGEVLKAVYSGLRKMFGASVSLDP
jgi:hypothetical protein